MIKADDAAKFFIRASANGIDDPMTNLRLQKLLYFSQGWALVRTGKPLFEDKIEAWDFGPVISSVYQTYKPFGSNSIILAKSRNDEPNLSGEERDLLIDVFLKYRGDSTFSLMSKTHEKGGPWDSVYERGLNKEIPLESIKEYFSSHDSLKPFRIDRSKIPVHKKDPIYGDDILPVGALDSDEYDEYQ